MNADHKIFLLMHHTHKLAQPLFILSLLVLIVNDWYGKTAWHNALTGKLSDVAGLFAFPFLWSVLFPKQSRAIHLGTAVAFVFWKSGYAQAFIDLLNNCGWPVGRTIDVTDNIALLSVLLSYRAVQAPAPARWAPATVPGAGY